METKGYSYSTKIIRFYFKNIIKSRYHCIFRYYSKSNSFSESIKKNSTDEKTGLSVYKNNSSVKTRSQIKAEDIFSEKKDNSMKEEINQVFLFN